MTYVLPHWMICWTICHTWLDNRSPDAILWCRIGIRRCGKGKDPSTVGNWQVNQYMRGLRANMWLLLNKTSTSRTENRRSSQLVHHPPFLFAVKNILPVKKIHRMFVWWIFIDTRGFLVGKLVILVSSRLSSKLMQITTISLISTTAWRYECFICFEYYLSFAQMESLTRSLKEGLAIVDISESTRKTSLF